MVISLSILDVKISFSGDPGPFAHIFSALKMTWTHYLTVTTDQPADLNIVLETGDFNVKIHRETTFTVRVKCQPNNQESLPEFQKLLLSMLGELIELKGYVRLHAALVSDQHGRTTLIEGPPGCGKSTFSLKMLSEGGKIYTDEYTLWRNGQFFCLALPLSIVKGNLQQHWPAGASPQTKPINPTKTESIAVITPSKSFIEINQILIQGPRFPRFAFCYRVFLGIGNVQMWRYRFQISGIKSLIVTAFYRVRAIVQILFLSESNIKSFTKYPEQQFKF